MDSKHMDQAVLSAAMELFYTFVMESYDNYTMTHDYGTGKKINMVEIHTLSLIADHPGITVSETAQMWRRTLSAASQNVNKLQQKGLITKQKEAGNDKTIHLYVTEEGQRLSDLHKENDQREFQKTYDRLRSENSDEDLNTMLRIMRLALQIVREDNERKRLG